MIFENTEGLAYHGKNGKYGFIDQSGNFVIPSIYDDASNFSEGFAAVKQKGKWGYISKD